MQTSTQQPMIGAVSSGDYDWSREDRRAWFFGRGLKRGESGRRDGRYVDTVRRSLKRAERAQLKLTQDLMSSDEALGALLDDEAADFGDLFADEDRWFDDSGLDFTADDGDAYAEISDTEWNEAWDAYHAFLAAEAAAERAARLARYTLDDRDLPGWDAPTVYEPAGDFADNNIFDVWEDA